MRFLLGFPPFSHGRLTLALLMLLCPTALAQKGMPRFERIGAAQGLSHSIVNCIVQDSRGFMWFGTDNGLNRYDGYRCKVFRHDPDKPTLFFRAFDEKTPSIGNERSPSIVMWNGPCETPCSPTSSKRPISF